jgi:hypothetical protein
MGDLFNKLVGEKNEDFCCGFGIGSGGTYDIYLYPVKGRARRVTNGFVRAFKKNIYSRIELLPRKRHLLVREEG